MRLSLGITLAAAFVLVVAASPAANAGLNTYYQEDFTGQENLGISSNTAATYSNSSWGVNGTNADFSDTSDFAKVSGGSFQFQDIGGSGATGPGTVVFETMAASIMIGNPADFTFLTMTLNAALSRNAFAAGEQLLIESLLDNVVVDSTTLTTAGSPTVTHNLLDNVTANTTHSYVLRVTATQVQNGTPLFTLDNILVQGASVPEPASMSLLGMGVLAMCGAGYRRRRNSTALDV